MLDIKVLLNIRKDAIDSIKKDSDGTRIEKRRYKIFFFFLWYLIPICGVLTVFYKKIVLSNFQDYIGTSITLFTGLFFSLLLSLGDKLRTEKSNKNIDESNYLRFKENMKQISKITQFIILSGILIFVLLLINSLVKTSDYKYIEISLTALSIYLLSQYTISIGFLLQRFHHTMKDELNNTI
jgi:uncharacterized membrane protein